MRTEVYYLLKSAAVRYRIWLGTHGDCSRSQCTYSHIEDRTLLLLGCRAWGWVFCCSFLLPQGCEKGLEEEYVSPPLPIPSFFPSSQTISQLQTNPNQKIFSLHLLAELTKVIKAIGSPVQKEQNVPCLHHLYNHGDAKHLHRVSMEMLNSAGPCIPAKERHSETEPLTTLLSIQPVFPPACSPPIQSVSPSLATRILKTTTVQLVSRWSKSPPRA